MAIKMRKRKARVLRPAKFQVGRTNRKKDERRSAMRPGLRVSKTGKKYYEYRKNRTDLRGRI